MAGFPERPVDVKVHWQTYLSYTQMFNFQIPGLEMLAYKPLSCHDTTLHEYDFSVVAPEVYKDTWRMNQTLNLSAPN